MIFYYLRIVSIDTKKSKLRCYDELTLIVTGLLEPSLNISVLTKSSLFLPKLFLDPCKKELKDYN